MGHLCPRLGRVGVLTALRDGSRRGQVSVLSVHVVSSTTRIIAQPDAKILYLQGRLLVDLSRQQQQSFSASPPDFEPAGRGSGPSGDCTSL